MNVRCPSCSASLRVNEERLAGRRTARCPRCQASVPLTPEARGSGEPTSTAAAGETILVTCSSCGVRLKAPASRAGSTSSCPKCHAPVMIQSPVRAAAAAAAGGEREETSSAATRRIDSRMLGRIGLPEQAPPPAGVDLDAFVRPAATASHETPEETPRTEPGDPQGLAATLLKPPVEQIEKIAEEIRDTAQKLTESPAATPPRPAASPVHKTASAAPRTAPPRPLDRSARPETATHIERPHATAQEAPTRFTVLRCLLSGGISGALVGGAAAGAAAGGMWVDYLAPLWVPVDLVPLPEAALRVALPMVLGALSGFIAAALSSSNVRGWAMLARCGGMGLLMGTASGLAGGVITGTGPLVWPIAHWMRDLLLVGLLTPAVNRFFPVASSR